jgi:hypothetical protein
VKIVNRKALLASLLILGIIAAFAATFNFVIQAQTGPVLAIMPPTQDVQVCNDFFAEVWVYNITGSLPLDAFDVIIHFNSTVVNATGVSKGAFVPVADPFLFDLSLAGQVHFWDLPVNGLSASGSGVIANITFHCVGPGLSPLHIDSGSHLFAPSGQDIAYTPEDGQVTQELLTAHTYIDPPTYSVPVCVPFTVNVTVENVTDLYSFSLVLSYDTAYVDCLDIVDACFLPAPKQVTHKLINDSIGEIEFNATSLATQGRSGDGPIATIKFHCTGGGESTLMIDTALYWDSKGNVIPTTIDNGRVIQIAYWEPTKLVDIVDWPGVFAYRDMSFPLTSDQPLGYTQVLSLLTGKGYVFEQKNGNATRVNGTIEKEDFSGNVTSWWSSNTLSDGTRACILSAKMSDGSNMSMAFVTNLLGPEQVFGSDPYIIINAMPYVYVRFYWYEWPTSSYPAGRIVSWSYWWYDSDSHPNWFWGIYWWWRVYVKAYTLGLDQPWPFPWVYWRPWWGWWWHWVYWKHWDWWSTYFPYDS